MTAIDIDHLRKWVGREKVVEQTIEPFPARALAGLLDHQRLPVAGEPLPLPWHWAYFLDTPLLKDIGEDGHPRKGAFLPPVPLPRRMWAAGSLSVDAPMYVGASARKVSTIRSVDLKEGKSGILVFVNVEHELHQNGHLCIREEQNLVYREAATAATPLASGEPARETAQWLRVVRPDPALLFRFSALTYNGHRIHYDRDYATRQEFYPALVIQGPLLASLLLDLVRREVPGSRVTQFGFRGLRPAFDTDELHLCGKAEGDQVRLWTCDSTGAVGMTASAIIE